MVLRGDFRLKMSKTTPYNGRMNTNKSSEIL
jgi:hypothetical protein